MHLSLSVSKIAIRFKVFVMLFITFVAPNVCVDSVFNICFVMHYLVSFLVLQSSSLGKDS